MNKMTQCPLCGGEIEKGTTTFTADYETGVVVIRHVPADICGQCGESWIEDKIAKQVEESVQTSKQQNRQFAVIDMAAWTRLFLANSETNGGQDNVQSFFFVSIFGKPQIDPDGKICDFVHTSLSVNSLRSDSWFSLSYAHRALGKPVFDAEKN